MDVIDETNQAKADLLNAGADLAVAENGWRQYVADMDKRLMAGDEPKSFLETQIKELANLREKKTQLSKNLEKAELKKRRKKRQAEVEQDLLVILAANRN